MYKREKDIVDPSYLETREEPLVRALADRHEALQQLVDEVIFLLKYRIRQASIETASIYGRVKSTASFVDKIRRKRYKNPIDEITDLAAVRVVCLHPSQIRLIEREFRRHSPL